MAFPPGPRIVKGAAFVAIVLALGTAAAAVVTYGAPSALTITATAPPVVLEVGNGGAKERHFAPALTTSPNGTTVEGAFRARAGADVTVKDVLRVVEAAGAPQSVTLAGERVSSDKVELFTWTVRDRGTTVATLDMRSASPSASFVLPSGSTYTLDLRMDLEDGSGKDTVPASFTLRVEVR